MITQAIQQLIFEATSPYEALEIAHSHKKSMFWNWDVVKVSVMEKILRAKLKQHDIVREKLLESGNLVLVEDSLTDNFWEKSSDWKWENHIGKIWMELRDELEK